MDHSTPSSIGNSVGKAEDDMARKKKLVNNTPYPDYVIETVARCLWPDIQAFFESEEGKREFAIWKEEQETKKANAELGKRSK